MEKNDKQINHEHKMAEVILESDHPKKRNTDVQIKHSRYNGTKAILAQSRVTVYTEGEINLQNYTLN